MQNKFRLIIAGMSLLLVPLSLSAQPQYPVQGTYKGKSAQGMAIYGDNAYLLNNEGTCRVYDLKNKEVRAAFSLGSAGKHNHANCASFGVEHYAGNKTLPVLYVAECTSPNYRCFVENIEGGKAELVQTIQYVADGKTQSVQTWVVDRKKKHIYAIRRQKMEKAKPYTELHEITKFKLPRLSRGTEVKLTNKDVEDRFIVYFPNVLQGATIRDRYLYLPVGFQNMKVKKPEGDRALVVIDLKKKKIAKTIDLTNLTENEPEDADFYEKKLMLYCGQSGGIYVLNLE